MPPPVATSDRLDYAAAADGDTEGAPISRLRMRKFLAGLLRYWWVPALGFLLALGAMGAFVFQRPPTYVSTASMQETLKVRLPEGSLFAEETQNFLDTQAELLRMTRLSDAALARLSASSNAAPIPRDADGKALPVKVRISQAGKSAIFVLEAKGSHPGYLEDYLNALMDVYQEFKRNQRRLVSGDTLASITEQVQRAERDLQDQQDILTAFQQTNNLAILQEEGTIAGGYLARLQTQQSELELERRLLAAASTAGGAGGNSNDTGVDFHALTALGSQGSGSVVNPGQQTAMNELALLKIQHEKLDRYLLPKHPKMVKLNADIERAEKLVEIFSRQSRSQLESTRQAIDLRLENVMQSIQEWEVKVVKANTRIAEAERLRINVQRAQSVYERLAMLLQNVGISRNIDQETLAILERASPAKRSYVQDLTLMGVAGFLGLGLGVAIIFLLTVRDDRFNSLGEVNEEFGSAVIGQVPDAATLGQGDVAPLLKSNDERYSYAESFRGLRSALFFMATGGAPPRILLITSAVPNEGKSTIAANLALTLAQGGSRVVLVDADLRKGTLHSLLELPCERGLSHALLDPNSLEQCVQWHPTLNFALLSRGSSDSNSGGRPGAGSGSWRTGAETGAGSDEEGEAV